MEKAVHVSHDEQGLCDCEGILCGAVINGVKIKPGTHGVNAFITELHKQGKKEYTVTLPKQEPVKMSVQEIDFLLRRMEEIAETKIMFPYSWESLIV